MISLAITLNPFAPINHACPYCGAQPAEDCSQYSLVPKDGMWPLYHRERIDLAFKRGMETWETGRRKIAIAQRG